MSFNPFLQHPNPNPMPHIHPDLAIQQQMHPAAAIRYLAVDQNLTFSVSIVVDPAPGSAGHQFVNTNTNTNTNGLRPAPQEEARTQLYRLSCIEFDSLTAKWVLGSELLKDALDPTGPSAAATSTLEQRYAVTTEHSDGRIILVFRPNIPGLCAGRLVATNQRATVYECKDNGTMEKVLDGNAVFLEHDFKQLGELLVEDDEALAIDWEEVLELHTLAFDLSPGQSRKSSERSGHSEATTAASSVDYTGYPTGPPFPLKHEFNHSSIEKHHIKHLNTVGQTAGPVENLSTGLSLPRNIPQLRRAKSWQPLTEMTEEPVSEEQSESQTAPLLLSSTPSQPKKTGPRTVLKQMFGRLTPNKKRQRPVKLNRSASACEVTTLATAAKVAEVGEVPEIDIVTNVDMTIEAENNLDIEKALENIPFVENYDKNEASETQAQSDGPAVQEFEESNLGQSTGRCSTGTIVWKSQGKALSTIAESLFQGMSSFPDSVAITESSFQPIDGGQFQDDQYQDVQYENALSPVSPPDPSLIEALQRQVQEQALARAQNGEDSDIVVQRGFDPIYPGDSSKIEWCKYRLGGVKNWFRYPPIQIANEFLPDELDQLAKDYLDMGGLPNIGWSW